MKKFLALLAGVLVVGIGVQAGVVEVTDAGSLRTALAEAQPQDTVVLKANYTVPAGETLEIPAGVTLDVFRGFTLTNKGTIDNQGTLGVVGTFANSGSYGKGENGLLIRKTQVYAIETRNFINKDNATARYDVTRTATGTITGATQDKYQVSADDTDSWHDAVDLNGNPVTGPGECLYCTFGGSGVLASQTNMNRNRRYVASATLSDIFALIQSGNKGYGNMAVMLKDIKTSGTMPSLSSSTKALTVDAAGFTLSRGVGSYTVQLANNGSLKFMNGSMSGSVDLKGTLVAVNATLPSVSANAKSVNCYLYCVDSSRSGFSVSNAGTYKGYEYVISDKRDNAYSTSYTTIYGGMYKNRPSSSRLASTRAILIVDGDYKYSVVPTPVTGHGAEVVSGSETTYYANANTAVAEAPSGSTVRLLQSASQNRAISSGQSLTIACTGEAAYTGTISSSSSGYTIASTTTGNSTYYFTAVDPAQATATVNGLYFDSVAGAIKSIDGNADASTMVKILKDTSGTCNAGCANATSFTLDLNGHQFGFGTANSGLSVTVVDTSAEQNGKYTDKQSYVGTLHVEAGIYTQMDPKNYLVDGKVSYVAADGYFHIADELPTYEATIGTSELVYFVSADTAVQKATAGNTVTLYASASANNSSLTQNGQTLKIVLVGDAAYSGKVTTTGANCTITKEQTGNLIVYTCSVDESKYGAKIGTQYYATAQAAIQAVKAGETVVLLKDVEGCLPDIKGSAANQTIAYSLDLNGHTFSYGTLSGDTSSWFWKTYYKIHHVTITDSSRGEVPGSYGNANGFNAKVIIDSITGGTFTFDPSAKVPATGYEVSKPDGSHWTVKPEAPPVAQIEGGDSFKTLQAALDGVAADQVVKLLTDNSESAQARAVSFILDCNGHAFSGTVTPASGFEFKQMLDGRWSHAPKPGVARVVGGETYPSLQEAFAAVPLDGVPVTIELLGTCDLGNVGAQSGVTVLEGQNIVLDLKGFSVYVTGSGSAASSAILNRGSLKILDSSDGKDGLISYRSLTPASDASYRTTPLSCEAGQLTVESGRIFNTTSAESEGVVSCSSAGEVVLKGGVYNRNAGWNGSVCTLQAFTPSRVYVMEDAENGVWRLLPYPSVEVTVLDPVRLTTSNSQVDTSTSNNGRNKIPFTLDVAYKYEITGDTAVNDPYSTWHIDFVIAYDRRPTSYAVQYAGQHDASPLQNRWFVTDMPAGTSIRMFFSNDSRTIDFSEVAGKKMQAGLYNTDPANIGITATIELRMFKTVVVDEQYEEPRQNGDYIVLDSRQFKFSGKGAMTGGIDYPSIAEALTAASNGGTVKLTKDYSGGETFTVSKPCTIDVNGFAFTGTIAAGVGYMLDASTPGIYVVTEDTRPAVSVGTDDNKVPVTFPEWVYPADRTTKDARAAWLETPQSNGNKTWQNLVMGIGATEVIKTVPGDVSMESVTVRTPVASFSPVAGTGVAVRYRLMASANGTSWTPKGGDATSPSFPVPVSTIPGVTLLKIVAVFTAADAGAGAPAETVESANVMGVKAVEQGAVEKPVSVTWNDFGGSPLTVDKLVSFGVTDGDEIAVWNPTAKTYSTWKRQADVWGAATSTAGKEGTPAAEVALARGTAFWYKRAEAGTFLQIGEHDAKTPITTATSAGDAKAPVNNLLVSPWAAPADLAKIAGAEGDRIVLLTSDREEYYFGKDVNDGNKVKLGRDVIGVNKWGGSTRTFTPVGSLALPANAGCWYISLGGSQTTVEWPAPAATGSGN